MLRKFFNYLIIFVLSIFIFTSCNLIDNAGIEEDITSYDTTADKCYSNPYEIDNLEIVNRVLNGIKEEKIGIVIRYFAKNIELTFDGEESYIPFADTYFGERSAKKGLQKFFRIVDITDLIIENQVEGEESITSYTRLQGKIPSTKKTFDMEYVFTFEINERGKVEKCFVTYNVCSVGLALSTRGKGHIISDTTTSPQLQFLYSYFKAVSKPFLATATYEEIRAANPPTVPNWPADAEAEDITIAGLEGTIVRIPPNSVNDKIILYLHGGGFIAGYKTKYAMFNYQLAKDTNIPVLAVNYSLAPEYPFSRTPQECYAVYLELLENYDPENIAIIGESSGGNLVLATALLARENNTPLPGALIPLSPWLDLTNSSETYISNQEAEAMLSPEYLNMAANHYLNGNSPLNPIASPIYANIPHNFPPVYLAISTNEILLGDSVEMFKKLISAKADVTIELCDGSIHGWPIGVGMAPEPARSTARIAEFIVANLGN